MAVKWEDEGVSEIQGILYIIFISVPVHLFRWLRNQKWAMKKSPLKKTSSQKKAIAKRRAWAEFSKFIRDRDKNICFTCGGTATQAGHFIHNVSMLALQFDERNVHAQCSYCNLYLHGNLAEYTLRIIDKYGREAVDELFERKKNRDSAPKMMLKDYEELYEKYK